MVIAGLWLLTTAIHHYIIAPASVLPQVSADLGVSPSLAVWLVSAVPGAWAITNFAMGVWIDRLGDYRMISIGTGVVILAAAWSWWAASNGDFLSLMASRLAAGVAVGIIWTASTNLIGGTVSIDNRALAIGIYVTSAPAGFAVGQVTTPFITEAMGWPASLLVMILPVIGAFVLITVTVRQLAIEPTTNTASMAENFAAVLQHRALWFGCAMAFAAYSYYLFINSWMPTYLGQRFALSPELGGALAAVFPAMGVLSRAGGGFASDRLLGRRRIPVLRVSFLISLPTIVVMVWTDHLGVIVTSLIVGGFVIQLTFGVVYSYVQEAVDRGITGTALAFLTTAGISGAFLAPIIAGALIDWTGAYLSAFAYAGVLTAIGLVIAFVAPESRE